MQKNTERLSREDFAVIQNHNELYSPETVASMLQHFGVNVTPEQLVHDFLNSDDTYSVESDDGVVRIYEKETDDLLAEMSADLRRPNSEWDKLEALLIASEAQRKRIVAVRKQRPFRDGDRMFRGCTDIDGRLLYSIIHRKDGDIEFWMKRSDCDSPLLEHQFEGVADTHEDFVLVNLISADEDSNQTNQCVDFLICQKCRGFRFDRDEEDNELMRCRKCDQEAWTGYMPEGYSKFEKHKKKWWSLQRLPALQEAQIDEMPPRCLDETSCPASAGQVVRLRPVTDCE